MFKLVHTPLESFNLKEKLVSPQAGAFCAFEGRVRNHNEGKRVEFLEYEAQEVLCQKEADRIFEEVQKRFNVIALKCYHRVGKVEIGEMAVWVGVVAAHRDEAFQACRYIIDEVKKRLPIWKKEFYADGNSGWINAQSSPAFSENDYYARQIILPEVGVKGQNKLKKAKALVIGAGGLGSSALMSLAGSGVGTIGIAEFDQLDVSNLHRQYLYSSEDIGKDKVQLAFQRIKVLNPFVHVALHQEKVNQNNVESLLKKYDIICDCSDNFQTKFLLNDAAVLLKKILIQASIYQWEGQLRVYAPSLKIKQACLRCLWPQIPEENCVGTCAEAGVMGSIPALLGHWQALEAIKLILNKPKDNNAYTLFVNFENNSSQRIFQKVNPACPVCGENARIQPFKKEDPQSAIVINIDKLKNKELSGYAFIDIRETKELINKPARFIKGMHFPFSQLGKKKMPIDEKKKYILFCARGGRSLFMVSKLRQEGVSNVFSLYNGVKAIDQYFLKNGDCS